MFEIDRLKIETKIHNDKIYEGNYYAVSGSSALILGQRFSTLNEDGAPDEDFKNIYQQHIIEARAMAMKEHLLEMDADERYYESEAARLRHGENIKKSMLELDALAYYKAEKLRWEDKINDELSKREEQINSQTDESRRYQ